MPKEEPVALSALARPLWRGRINVDAMTIAATEAAEKHAGFTFTVTQGSYQRGAGDPNSAGTHDMGGVVDFSVHGMTEAKIRRMVRALRAVGFFASDRLPSEGPWVRHVHAVLGGHPLLATSAARQWDAYLHGRNGLKNNGPDRGPRITPIPRFIYPPKDDDMAYTDWPQKDRDALAADVVTALLKAEVANKNPSGKTGTGTVAKMLTNIEVGGDAIQQQLNRIEAALLKGGN